MDMMENYKRWLGKVTEEDLLTELKAIEGKEEEINDRFYRDLEFGTGGTPRCDRSRNLSYE